MLIIRKNQVNNLIATVSMNKTLPNPYYLFSFQHIASKERISFYPQVITSNVRYDKFRFVEATTTNLSVTPPQVYFDYLGQYYYSIYENVSSASTDPSLSYNKLESGRAWVIVGDDNTQECFFEPYISNDEDFAQVIYVSEEEEACQIPTPSVTPTNTNTPTVTSTVTPSPTTVLCKKYTFSNPSSSVSIAWDYRDCDGTLIRIFLQLGDTQTRCAKSGSIVLINPGLGGGTVTDNGLCDITPTPTRTPTNTPTPSITPSITPTNTATPTNTPTNTTTSTNTPTPSITPTQSPVYILTEFTISSQGYPTTIAACTSFEQASAWSNGATEPPVVGDIIYGNDSGTILLPAGYYKVPFVFPFPYWIRLNSSSQVIETGDCGF